MFSFTYFIIFQSTFIFQKSKLIAVYTPLEVTFREKKKKRNLKESTASKRKCFMLTERLRGLYIIIFLHIQ